MFKSLYNDNTKLGKRGSISSDHSAKANKETKVRTDSDSEGLTKDLVEKLRTGELTPEQVKSELKKRGLGHHGIDDTVSGVLLLVCFVLIYISTFAEVTKIETFEWIANLPAINFPISVRCVAAIALISGLMMMIWASRLLSRKGGLSEADESVAFVREGPYRVVRHPIILGILAIFVLPPFIFSEPLSYTILTAIGQAVLVIWMLLSRRTEEKKNLKKWGNVYKRYMQDVPKFNVIRGLWRLTIKR